MDDPAFERLIAALVESGERGAAAVASVPDDAWDETIHTGGGAWTRRQLLAHIAANDLRQLVRIRIGAARPDAGDAAAHEAELDVHAWNGARVAERAGRGPDELAAELLVNRDRLVVLLRSLTPAERDRPMPYRGQPTPLPEMVERVIGHLDAHAAELAPPT